MKIPEIQEDPNNFNMAPMIDMVFQLLIFFMVMSHFNTTTNVELQIPTALHAVVPNERPDRIVVNIKKDGSFFCAAQPAENLDTLKNMVKGYKEVVPAIKVYVRADKETPHKYVRQVMNAMGELGIDDFIFGAFKPGEGQ